MALDEHVDLIEEIFVHDRHVLALTEFLLRSVKVCHPALRFATCLDHSTAEFSEVSRLSRSVWDFAEAAETIVDEHGAALRMLVLVGIEIEHTERGTVLVDDCLGGFGEVPY
jgi:hypothetical protein